MPRRAEDSSTVQGCLPGACIGQGGGTHGCASPIPSAESSCEPVSLVLLSMTMCEPSEVRLLPTPVANDDNRPPEAHLAMKQRMGERDGSGANRSQITSLAVLARAGFQQPVNLLPTPRAQDATNSRSATSTRKSETYKPGENLSDVAHRWAGYAPALISSPGDSPVGESPVQASEKDSITPSPFCGTRCGESLGRFDPATFSSRTFGTPCQWLLDQGSLLDPCGELYWPTWPRSATVDSSGMCFPLRPSAPRTSVSASSALLPTPRASLRHAREATPEEGMTRGETLPSAVAKLLPSPLARTNGGTEVSGDSRTGGPMRQEAVTSLLPTPTVNDAKNSTAPPSQAGRNGPGLPTVAASLLTGASTDLLSDDGKPSTDRPRLRLSADFVAWMMGTPSCNVCGLDWTDPKCGHSASDFLPLETESIATSDGSLASTS